MRQPNYECTNDNAPASFDIGARIRLAAGASGSGTSLAAILPQQATRFNPSPVMAAVCPGRACNSALRLATAGKGYGVQVAGAVKRRHRVKGKPCGLVTDGWLHTGLRFQTPIPDGGGRGAYSLQIHRPT